jgi:putative proteasome-type protease
MFQAAVEAGKALREVVLETQEENGEQGRGRFTASLILAGQIKGMEPRLFLIYPEGNFIEASWDTPFFQVGETKYGRPILIRGYDRNLSFEDAVKLLMVSFDSTLKANLSVGLPLDLMVIERDSFAPTHQKRIESGDSYFESVSAGWSEALRTAFHSLPDYSFYREAESGAKQPIES